MSLRAGLQRFYWRMEGVVAPGLRYSAFSYEEVLDPIVQSDTVWLDIGCGREILPSWRLQQERTMVSRCKQVYGVDRHAPSLREHSTISNRAVGDISELPFPSNSFDLTTANMVVEHLDKPEAQLRELARVLKPGGRFVFHTPNLLGYPALLSRLIPFRLRQKIASILEGRPADDVFPTFYRCNHPETIKRLATQAGLEVERIRPIVTTAAFVVIPPLAFAELILIRALMTNAGKPLRPNLIVVLRKPAR